MNVRAGTNRHAYVRACECLPVCVRSHGLRLRASAHRCVFTSVYVHECVFVNECACVYLHTYVRQCGSLSRACLYAWSSCHACDSYKHYVVEKIIKSYRFLAATLVAAL